MGLSLLWTIVLMLAVLGTDKILTLTFWGSCTQECSQSCCHSLHPKKRDMEVSAWGKNKGEPSFILFLFCSQWDHDEFSKCCHKCFWGSNEKGLNVLSWSSPLDMLVCLLLLYLPLRKLCLQKEVFCWLWFFLFFWSLPALSCSWW